MNTKDSNEYRFYLLFVAISIAIFSRNTLTTIGLGFFNNLVLVLFILISLYFFLTEKSLKRCYVYIYVYVVYCMILLIASPTLSNYASYGVGIIGVTNLVLFLPFWMKLYSKLNGALIVKVLCMIGVINAVGAVIQFFVSPDLFGLISHQTYAIQEHIEKDNVTQRAISFISSPQSLSLVLATTLVLITQVLKKRGIWWKLAALIVFIGGLLTVSKAFFLFLTVYFIFQYLRLSKLTHLIFGCGIFVLLVIAFPQFFERILYIQHYLVKIESYSAFSIWKEAILFPENVVNIIIGSGIGLLSRGAQSLFGYQILGGSTESYIIQLYLETGIIGVFLFLLMFLKAFYSSLKVKREISSVLLAFLVVGAFTPAIYGFSAGFYFYSILVLATNREAVYKLSVNYSGSFKNTLIKSR